MALEAAPLPWANSSLSALTFQPDLETTAPAESSRLISAMEAQALPLISETSSSFTNRTAPAGSTCMRKSVLTVPAALVANTDTVYTPAVVATPDTTPVPALMARPAGRPVALKDVAPEDTGETANDAPPAVATCSAMGSSLGVPVLATRMNLATDGTPCAFMANSM